MYTIYALVDPSDGLIRYVGMTQDIYARFIQHVNCESRNTEKNLWVTSCRARNLMIQMRTLETIETREQALETEKKWIEYYCSLGMPLFNRTNMKNIHDEKQTEMDALSKRVNRLEVTQQQATDHLAETLHTLKEQIADLPSTIILATQVQHIDAEIDGDDTENLPDNDGLTREERAVFLAWQNGHRAGMAIASAINSNGSRVNAILHKLRARNMIDWQPRGK